jgi:hypothetical protein
VLAAFCGTPGAAYHSERLPRAQLERLEEATRTAGWGELAIQRASRFKKVRLPSSAHA